MWAQILLASITILAAVSIGIVVIAVIKDSLTATDTPLGLSLRVNRNLVRVVHSGGPASLVGIVFILLAVTMLMAFIDLGNRLWLQPSLGGWFLWTVLCCFALGILSLGIWMLVGRKGVVLDRARNEIVVWWGLICPFKKRSYPLEQFVAVSVSVELKPGPFVSRSVFPVRLEGLSTSVEHDYCSYSTFEGAMELATQVSTVTGLPVRASFD